MSSRQTDRCHIYAVTPTDVEARNYFFFFAFAFAFFAFFATV